MQLFIKLVMDPYQLFKYPNEVFLLPTIELVAMCYHRYRMSAAFDEVLVRTMRSAE